MATFSAILTWMLAGLFVLHIQTAVACPTINETIRRHEYDHHLKRWYGWGNPSEGEPATRNAWPLVTDPNDPSVPDGIDPRIDRFQPIRYCWVDQTSYDNLNDLFLAATAKWDKAMQYSALYIVPDQGPNRLLCSQGAREDALRISDVSQQVGASSSATPGYYHAEYYTKVGRHILTIKPQFRAYGIATDPRNVNSIAHEIGHVIGLLHEHSRRDRESVVWFYCDQLMDFQTISQVVATQYPGRTMDEACTDYSFARKLRFSVVNYLPDPKEYVIGQPQYSYTYDLDSLMHYGSFDGSRISQYNFINTNFPDNAVMLKAIPGMTKQSKYGQMIWFGANEDPAKVVISEGDVARVAQLYPDPEKDGSGHRTGTTWAGTSLGWMAKRTAAPESGNGMPA